MGRRRKEKAERRKKVSIGLLERKHAGKIATPYRIMEELLESVGDHAHLRDAKIAIAWRFGKKADADGRLWLGTAKKGSDLDRAMHGYDFVIILNHEVWNQAGFSDQQMTALIDHELMHCAVSHDTNGQAKLDELGRKVFRIRKHDLEEFEGVVRRRGLWKSDIRTFVEAADEARKRPLLDQAEKAEAVRSNGKAKATKDGKYPARIQLVRDIMGVNTDEAGMFEHAEFEVIGWCNDKAVVRALNGFRVMIPPESYVVLRWQKTKPPTMGDVKDDQPELEPQPQTS